MFIPVVFLAAIFATPLPAPLTNVYIPFHQEPRRVIVQVEVPDIRAGDCLIIDATAQISARDPWNGNYPNNLYIFPGAAFLASQILMYDEPLDYLDALDAPIGGEGVVKITSPNGVDLNAKTSIPYVQPTLRGSFFATEDMGTQWVALVMWVRSTAAGRWDYLRVFPDNHAGLIVQQFDESECRPGTPD